MQIPNVVVKVDDSAEFLTATLNANAAQKQFNKTDLEPIQNFCINNITENSLERKEKLLTNCDLNI